MAGTNDFQAFAIGSGANVESQAAYLTDPALPLGQQSGVASSALNNKVLRQASVVASQLAQYICNQLNANVADNGVSAEFLAQLQACIQFMAPVMTRHTSSTGTHNPTYYFFVASANATSGATYTNSTFTFTVAATISTGTILQTTGGGAPAASGTLTKATGTGDSTITYYAYRAPLYMIVDAIGGGGAGAASGTGSPGTAGTSGATTFGTSLITCNGGANGLLAVPGSSGGAVTISAPAVALLSLAGSPGTGGINQQFSSNGSANAMAGGIGGDGPWGGAGPGGTGGGATAAASPAAAQANTGGGGGGGGMPYALTAVAGAGGQSGGYARAMIPTPGGSTYAWAVGVGATSATAGTSGQASGAGGSGLIVVAEYFQ